MYSFEVWLYLSFCYFSFTSLIKIGFYSSFHDWFKGCGNETLLQVPTGVYSAVLDLCQKQKVANSNKWETEVLQGPTFNLQGVSQLPGPFQRLEHEEDQPAHDTALDAHMVRKASNTKLKCHKEDQPTHDNALDAHMVQKTTPSCQSDLQQP